MSFLVTLGLFIVLLLCLPFITEVAFGLFVWFVESFGFLFTILGELIVGLAFVISYGASFLLEMFVMLVAIGPMLLMQSARELKPRTWYNILGTSVLGLITLLAYLFGG